MFLELKWLFLPSCRSRIQGSNGNEYQTSDTMVLQLPRGGGLQKSSCFGEETATVWLEAVIAVPRLPLFLPSVWVHNNTWEWITSLPIPCIIVNAKGRSKRARPGTKAKTVMLFTSSASGNWHEHRFSVVSCSGLHLHFCGMSLCLHGLFWISDH